MRHYNVVAVDEDMTVSTLVLTLSIAWLTKCGEAFVISQSSEKMKSAVIHAVSIKSQIDNSQS